MNYLDPLNPALRQLVDTRQVGIISRSDPVLRKAESAIIEGLKAKRVVPFLGAGISFSFPSCVLGAKDITSATRNVFLSWRADAVSADWRGRDQADPLEGLVGRCRMERLLDILVEVYGASGREIISVLDGQKWNDNHEALAVLAVHGYLPRCITLNFDILIEAAVMAKGGTPATVCPLLAQTIGNAAEATVVVLKPHGSFQFPGVTNDRLRFLSTTLAEVGDLPQEPNRRAIKRILESTSHLLVAGYSDDDWDVFPILEQNSSRLETVTWVEHSTQADLDSALREANHTLSPKVAQWLTGLGPRASLLLGNVTPLLLSCTKKITGVAIARSPDVRHSEANIREVNRKEVRAMVKRLEGDHARARLATACLLACTCERPIQRAILRELLHLPEGANVRAFACKLMADSFHMQSRYNAAIRWSKKAIAIWSSCPQATTEQVADVRCWLGTRYLCIAKRPPLRSFRSLLNWLRCLCLGLFHLRITKREANKAGSELIAGRAEYFAIELLHAWANALLLFLDHRSAAIRFVYRSLDDMYRRLFKRHPRLGQVEYYWMRHLETQIIGRRECNRSGAEIQLREIENSCSLTFNDLHIGNVFVSRALIAFTLDSDTESARELLKRALSHWVRPHWSGSSASSISGLRKVIVFGSYCGIIPRGRKMRSQMKRPNHRFLEEVLETCGRSHVDRR